MTEKQITNKDLKQFGMVLSGILLVIGIIHFFKGHKELSLLFLSGGTIILPIALVCARILKPVFICFTKIAHALGWFNTRLILIIVFYLLLTPISIIMRILRKDLLNKAYIKDIPSYWMPREKTTFSKEDLERQF